MYWPYGKGADGALNIGVNDPASIGAYTDLTAQASVSATSITVTDTTNFSVGDEVLIHKTQVGTDNSAPNLATRGVYEFNYVTSKTATTLSLLTPLTQTFASDTDGDKANNIKTQVLKVPHYTVMNLTSTISAPLWDGRKGGILCFRTPELLGAFNLNVSVLGFRGGEGSGSINGEGWAGKPSGGSGVPIDSGGGSGGESAAGGGHNGSGQNFSSSTGGLSYGFAAADLITNINLGGGGGGAPPPLGGDAGGAILAFVQDHSAFTGGFEAAGGAGRDNVYDSGAGSGGSVLIYAPTAFAGTVNVAGGVGKGGNGAGGYSYQTTP
jgi:hypothetical protein